MLINAPVNLNAAENPPAHTVNNGFPPTDPAGPTSASGDSH